MEHTQSYKVLASKIFIAKDDDDAASHELLFLEVKLETFVIPANKPLTHLVQTFGQLVHERLHVDRSRFKDTPGLTHKEVLEIFDAALEMDEWPEADSSNLYSPPKKASRPHAESYHMEALAPHRHESQKQAPDSQKGKAESGKANGKRKAKDDAHETLEPSGSGRGSKCSRKGEGKQAASLPADDADDR